MVSFLCQTYKNINRIIFGRYRPNNTSAKPTLFLRSFDQENIFFVLLADEWTFVWRLYPADTKRYLGKLNKDLGKLPPMENYRPW